MENSETNNSLGLNTLTSTGTTKNRKRVGKRYWFGNWQNSWKRVTKVRNLGPGAL
jgi:hypothetical protein